MEMSDMSQFEAILAVQMFTSDSTDTNSSLAKGGPILESISSIPPFPRDLNNKMGFPTGRFWSLSHHKIPEGDIAMLTPSASLYR